MPQTVSQLPRSILGGAQVTRSVFIPLATIATTGSVEYTVPAPAAGTFAGATLVARPALLMVATQAADEVHVAEVLRSCVLPSAYEPVAMNCCVPAREIEGFAGVTATDTSATVITVNVVEPVNEP